MTEEKIFGAIPLRTWNWLGVNDLKTSAPVEEKIIDVAPGETKKFFDVNFSGEPGAKKITINVEKSGRIEFVAADFGRGNFSTDLEINLTGDNSSAEVDAIYFGDGDRKSDYNYIIRHRGKKTVANMNIRGALKDKSDKIFRGTLDFRRGSKGSVGREFEEVLILSDGYIVSKLFKASLLFENYIEFRPKVKVEDADFLLKAILGCCYYIIL